MSAFIALSMLWFEVEKTTGIQLNEFRGLGHFLVLTGINACGLVLFFLAGKLWNKNLAQASIIFLFSVALRGFAILYIETLQIEGVFVSAERWSMHAGNIALAFIEIAFAFTQTKDSRTDSRIKDLEDQVQMQIDANQVLKDMHKAALKKQEKRVRDEVSAEVLTLNESLVHANKRLEKANAKADALEKQINALEKYRGLIDAANQPQRFGTRWRTITNEGVIVACDKDGNVLNGKKAKNNV